MEKARSLAPVLIGRGTVSNPRDMLRTLETLEHLTYRFVADGNTIDEGRAALVKLMLDDESSTLLVNGCLFLNVGSFRFLDFEPLGGGKWRFVLHGDGTTLELTSEPDADDAEGRRSAGLLNEDAAPGFEALMLLDDDEDEE